MRRLCASVALLLVTSLAALAAHDAPVPLVAAVARAADVASPVPLTTTPARPAAAPAALPVPLPAPVTAPTLPVTAPVTVPVVGTTPPSTAAPEPAPAPARTPGRTGVAPYLGLGTWVDVYDWSTTFARSGPTVSPADVDRMAEAGVQTLYIQASKHDSPTDVLEPELLQQFLDRARKRGLRVVVWYLPTLVDVGRDLQRLRAVAALRNVDGLAVDIEARNVTDVEERNRRLVELSAALRRALPGRTIGGIVLPPVALEVINPAYWPAFPYREIAPYYDVWMTMGYWTNRTKASGYRDAHRYTRENVQRLRNNLGLPDAAVHPIGGIGTGTTAADVEGYKQAVTAVRGIGGSLYDWHTTAAALWPHLRPVRAR